MQGLTSRRGLGRVEVVIEPVLQTPRGAGGGSCLRKTLIHGGKVAPTPSPWPPPFAGFQGKAPGRMAPRSLPTSPSQIHLGGGGGGGHFAHLSGPQRSSRKNTEAPTRPGPQGLCVVGTAKERTSHGLVARGEDVALEVVSPTGFRRKRSLESWAAGLLSSVSMISRMSACDNTDDITWRLNCIRRAAQSLRACP